MASLVKPRFSVAGRSAGMQRVSSVTRPMPMQSTSARPPVRLPHKQLGQNPASLRFVARAAEVDVTSTKTEQGLLELNQDVFYDYLAQQGTALVVVDFYTDWCGPCKVIYPELVKLAQDMPNIRVVKFNCNKQNKDLGVKLGIKVAPTFHLYKNSQKVAEMTGAKVDKLKALIAEHSQ